jgi:hypothetical protein
VGRRRRRGNREQRRRDQTSAPAQPRVRPGWRGSLDAWGGPLVVGGLLAAVVVVAAIVWFARPQAASDEPLLGDEFPSSSATHVQNEAQMEIPEGRPPVGGPHFPRWLAPQVCEQPVQDGFVVHSLEHGMVWISYNPGLVDDEELERLRDIAGDFGGDVLLSPRPANTSAVAVGSWERLLQLDEVDREQIEDFIEVNRNRSPEPGVRGGLGCE